jgi:hypothetical protein
VSKMATKVAVAINCSRQAQIRSKKFLGFVKTAPRLGSAVVPGRLAGAL